MAAGPWVFYESFLEYIADGTIDLDSGTFKMALFTSASNALSSVATSDALADLTNQVSGGNGYTTGGVTLTSVTWTRDGDTVTFDAADAQWTADSGSIVGRLAVIYQDDSVGVSDALVCVCLLDDAPADVTVTDGNTLTVGLDGIFTLAPAA